MHIRKYLIRFWPLYLVTALICVAIAMGGSKAVTTIAENTPLQREYTIIIDAGHGGEDGGATSCSGVLESAINLQIALRLDDLCHLLGLNTYMIRTTDISVYTEGSTIAAKKVSDLKQRVKIVEQTENPILVSIHQNTFADSQFHGAQVFFAPTQGSKALAEQLQTTLIQSVNHGSHRRCKEAKSVYLMQHIACPGVLIECGFLSNPMEEVSLRDPDYQKKLCCVIVSCLSQYINA